MLRIGTKEFKSKAAAKAFLKKEILGGYPLGSHRLQGTPRLPLGPDRDHPRADEKIGCGVQEFVLGDTRNTVTPWCSSVERTDQRLRSRSSATRHSRVIRENFRGAAKQAVQGQTEEFIDHALSKRLHELPRTGKPCVQEVAASSTSPY